MTKLGSVFIAVSFFVVWVPGVLAQRATPNAKASQYFTLLQEHPDNAYLFDRFYTAWFDTGTVESLEAFLKNTFDQESSLGNRLLLAFFYEQQGQDAAALALYRTVPLTTPLDTDYLFHKAKAEARNLQLATAIDDLVKARTLPCTAELNEKTGKLLATLYVRTQQKDKATHLWSHLLETLQDNQGLYKDLIELQIKEGLFDQAIATSDQFIAKNKDPYKTVMAMLRKGDIYQYKSETQKALDVYAEALKQVEQGSWLENQICAQIEEIFTRKNDLTGLRDHLTNLVTVHPKRTGIKKRLANLLIQMDQTDQALALFQDILKVTPGDQDNVKAYIASLTQAGLYDKAIQLMEGMIREHPQDYEQLILLADLYHNTQQEAKISETLMRFLDLSEKTEFTYTRVAGLLEQYRLPDKAEAVYQDMVSTWPESLTAQLVYASFLYRCDKNEQALALYKHIAAKGDLQMMLQASHAVGTRGHYDQALLWLEARYKEFSQEITYLNHLCKMAIRLEQYDKALTWARYQLNQAESFPMIQAALSQIMAAVTPSHQIQPFIKELEAKEPLSLQQLCLLSELLESQGFYAKADAVLAKASSIHPKIILRQQIQLYQLRQNWVRAAESLTVLIKRTEPPDVDLIRELIDLYQKSLQYNKAITWVQEWEKLSPTSTDAILYHSRLLNDMGKNEKAVKLLEAANREFNNNPGILAELAQSYLGSDQLDKAQPLYWRLYDTAPTVSQQLRQIQSLYTVAQKKGEIDNLLEKLKRLQQQNRTSSVPLLALAQVYKKMCQYEERRQALLEAMRIQIDDIDLIYELAGIEEAQGDWEKAIDTLQRALTLDHTSKTRLKIARLQIQHGHQDEGLRLLTDLAGGTGMDPRDAESIASTMIAMGDWEAAMTLLQNLLPLHPKDYKLRYLHAVALEESGHSKEAVEALIDLLGVKEELPDNTAKALTFPWNRQGIDVQIEEYLPSDAIGLLNLEQFHRTVYKNRYHQMQQGQSTSSSQESLPVMVSLPPTVTNLEDFVVCRLVTVAGQLNFQQRDQIRSDLKRFGIPNADIILEVSQLELGRLNEAIETLARKYPNHETIQAAWLMRRLEGRGCTLQEAKHVFDLFKNTHPRLAVIVGLGCYGKDPIASRLFKRALQMLETTIPSPGYYEGKVIAFILEKNNSPVRLTEAQQKLLDRYLIGWYAKLQNKNAHHDNIFHHVASLLAKRTNLSEYIDFLDTEITAIQPQTLLTGTLSNDPLIKPLAYPPKSLPGFPDQVINALRQNSNPSVKRSGQPVSRTHFSRLGKHLKQAKNPILKILMAMFSGQHEKAEQLIQTLMKNEPTSAAGYVLSASLATQQNKSQETIALLEKARSLGMAPKYHTLIDGALVATVIKLDSHTDAHAREIGKKAAVRLINQSLDIRKKEELRVATKTLGLEEQAQILERQIAAAPSPLAPAHGNQVGNLAQINQTKRYFELGKTDLACSSALALLKGTMNHPPMPFVSPRVQQIITLVKTHHATDKILKLANPGNNASGSQLSEYAALYILMGARQKGISIYQKAIKRFPHDPVPRLHLQMARLFSETNPRHGIKILRRSSMRTPGQPTRQHQSAQTNRRRR